MNFCKNCKFWEEWTETRNVCAKIRIDNDEGVDGFTYHLEADDDQGLDFEMITAPFFGCNKFQKKEVQS